MNIDCRVDEVEIWSGSIQNIKTYNLGTQHFFDSVHAIELVYFEVSSKLDVDKDLDLLQKYFKNLDYTKLHFSQYLSFLEIIKIINNWKINKVLCQGTNFDIRNFEYSIGSENGSLVLYDCEDQYYVKFKSIHIYSYSRYCKVQGEYVVIEYDHAELDLTVKGICKTCEDYIALEQ